MTVVAAVYGLVGIVALTVMRITPGSIQRHYETVATTDAETARLIREHPYLCAGSWAFFYLIGLCMWPIVVASSTRRQ